MNVAERALTNTAAGRTRREVWVAAAIGVTAVAVHVVWAGWVQLAPDEAYYWVWSRHLAAGYFDHPPAIAWLIRAGTALLGNTERGVRLAPALLGGVAALAAAAVARDKALAVLALAAMPLFALGGLLATPDVPLVAAWAFGLWAFSERRWGRFGLACGLAVMSKYTGALLWPLAVLSSPRDLRRPGPWRALGVAALVAAPNLWWNLRHDLVTIRFQLGHAFGRGGARPAVPLEFLGAQVGLVGPLLFLVALAWWTVGWRGEPTERACWWTSLPLVGLATAVGGEANWAAPAWVGVVMALARRGPRWRRAAWAGAGVSAVLSAMALVHTIHPLFRIPDDPALRLQGGRTLADAVAAWDIPVVYTERYQEAALIQFYSGLHAYAIPGVARPDQYDLWPVPVVEHALFVRPWRGGHLTSIEVHGVGGAAFERGSPNVVSAYGVERTEHAPDGTVQVEPAPLAGRWQVYEVWRKDSRPEGNE